MKTAPLSCALLLFCVPAAMAQDTYVNIGEYTDDIFAPAPPAPVAMPLQSYGTVPAPAYDPVIEPVAVMPETYAAPIAALPYAPLPGPVAAGPGNGDYEAARLAAYDTDGDGVVTTAEAVATLRPLAER